MFLQLNSTTIQEGEKIKVKLSGDGARMSRLINRVRGPYCKIRTEFFPVDLWPKREARGP